MYVIGLGEDGKPRGARFKKADDLVAIKAGDMKLTIVIPISKDVAELGKNLPEGRLYASGKLFVPNIKRELYEKIEAMLASPEDQSGVMRKHETTTDESVDANQLTTKSTTQSVPPVACISPMTSGLPRDWDSLSVGHLCLVHEDFESGWWEAVVESRENDVLTLRFRDYPKLPQMVRHISTVALINPGPL